MNNECKILDELKSILPSGMEIKQCEVTSLLEMMSGYVPDAFLYFKEKLLSVVEFKPQSIVSDSLYLKSRILEMSSYAQLNKISYILLLGKNYNYLLSEEDNFEITEALSVKEIVSILSVRMSEINDEPENLGHTFLKNLKSMAKKIGFQSNRTLDYINALNDSHLDWKHISSTVTTITLSSEFEMTLLKCILGVYSSPTLCRYTTKDALFRILTTEKQSLCSIVGMNDKSECYYVDDYWSKLDAKARGKKNINDRNLNDYYISSYTRMDVGDTSKAEDNLSMWRMYADDCKGVCLVCDVKEDLLKNGYVLAPISYAKREAVIEPDCDVETGECYDMIIDYEYKHPELDFIYQILHTKVGGYTIRFSMLDFWKHFFKAYEYKDEKEVRLLYKGNLNENKKWIQANNIFCPIVEKSIGSANNEFPFRLSTIILGPKFPEALINKLQIEQLISESTIYNNVNIRCELSEIDNYR